MAREKTVKTKSKLDIEEIVKLAKGRFSKKDASKALRMTTGDKIVLPSDLSYYITSQALEKFWKLLTGLPGLMFGRIFQIAGKPDSGKSTVAQLFMKAAQDQDVQVVLWDAEGKFDSTRFRDRMGGLPDNVLVAPSRNILEGGAQVTAYVKTIKELDPDQKILIVWDSVGASLNSAEDEENDDYSRQPGVTAKEVSWAIRRFNQLMEKFRDEDGNYTIAILAINQVYANIGSVGFKQKGGAELEYLSSLILEMSRKSNLTKTRNKQKIKHGITTIARVKKNHLFHGEDCVAELDLVISASGADLAQDVKNNNKNDDLEEDTD